MKKCKIFCVIIISVLLSLAGMKTDIYADEVYDNVRIEESEQKFYYFNSKITVEEINRNLPQELTLVSDGTRTPVKVHWKCFTDNYDTTSYYAYQFIPVIDERNLKIHAELNDEKKLPYVFVCFGDECVEDNAGSELSRASSYKSNKNMKKVINYLTKTMGLSSTAACGIAANIYCESNCIADNIEYGYTWDNGGGYGLCQWTNYPRTSSTGRRTELVKFGARSGLDYRDINTQLKYLFYEFTTSYNGVLNDIKNIKETEDKAQMAYDAAYIWCYEYEVPQDKEKTAIFRGNFAKTVWNEYGDINIKTRAPKLGNPSYPSLINKGRGFSVKGNVSSDKKISKIKVVVTDSRGKSATGKTVQVNSNTYNISDIDKYILFDKLREGQYYYKIYITTEDGTYNLMNKDFIVASDVPAIWSYNKPGVYECGNKFMLCGDIASSDTIVSVNAGIYKKKGGKQPVYEKRVDCSDNKIDLNIMNQSLLFHKLPGKQYYYRINVTTTTGSYSVLESLFKVEPYNIPKVKNLRQSYKSANYISLKWNRVSIASGYRIYRSDSYNGKYVKVATVKGSANVTYKNTGLKRKRAYYYRIYPYVIKNGITTVGPASDKVQANTR